MTGPTPAEWSALGLALRIASVAVIVALPFALALGLALSRGRFRGKALLEALLTLPLIVPPVVTGYALLELFGKHGVLGQALATIGISVTFRWTGAAIAAAVMAFPLLVLSIRTAFDSVDRRLEAAAESLGASAWHRFVSITLPLSMRGVLAGVVLGFARAFGEFGATISFVGSIPGQTRTLSIAIWELLNQPGGEESLQRLVWAAMAVALAASCLVGVLRGRSPAAEDARDA